MKMATTNEKSDKNIFSNLNQIDENGIAPSWNEYQEITH